ncbi:hypothetical protein [Pseudoalteromonas sp. G4]|uniref:hypothetical protein n=1 Tax=Pseudoalteromonas sp. G4 TaxID=2992761 RepID=UPI00237E9CBF|nr:hypothetical protein [Pseudoalteromonas sp. G4]MDE3274335.1 hypothetical protein [Pseudoalteromonas sp. G4]
MNKTRSRSKDPLTAAITSFLWPFLKSEGFIKTSARTFSREINNIVYQVIVDANGFGGRSSTQIVYCARTVFHYKHKGYLLGGRLHEDSWDLSNHELADKHMLEITELLRKEIMPWFQFHAEANNYDEALNNMKYGPIEPLLFERAVSKLMLGDKSTATINLREILSGDFEVWTDESSPASLLLRSIENANFKLLLDKWAEDNRTALKLPKLTGCAESLTLT